MTISEIDSDISFFTGADTNQFTAAQRLISVNTWLDKIWTMIIAAQNGWDADDPNLNNRNFVKTYDTVADQQYIDLDIVTNAVLKIKSLQIKWTSTGKWYKANPLDVSQLGIAKDSTTIANTFDKTEPYYDIQGRWCYFFPIPDVAVTGGVEAHYIRQADPFTSAQVTTGTKVPGFDQNFHRMLSIGPSLDWAIAKSKVNANQLAQMMADYEARLKQHYGRKQEDQQMILQSAFSDYN